MISIRSLAFMIDVVLEWDDLALVKVILQYHNPTTTYMDTCLKIFECSMLGFHLFFFPMFALLDHVCVSVWLDRECSSSF